jgi:hypothetical protein
MHMHIIVIRGLSGYAIFFPFIIKGKILLKESFVK